MRSWPLACLVAGAWGTLFVPCAASAAAADHAKPLVVMKTSLGTIRIELYPKKAPQTVKNFLRYVDDRYYDGTVFHRVIKGFMIQGGGFEPAAGTLRQKRTRKPIKNEAANGLKNRRGTIAMARTSDPNSATAQFFINHADNSGLDYPKPDGHGYAVFGKVVEGMEVVDRIAQVRTTRRTVYARGPSGKLVPTTFSDVPARDVVIKSVRRAATRSRQSATGDR